VVEVYWGSEGGRVEWGVETGNILIACKFILYNRQNELSAPLDTFSLLRNELRGIFTTGLE